MSHLPADIIKLIAGHLHARGLYSLSLVNKRYYAMLESHRSCMELLCTPQCVSSNSAEFASLVEGKFALGCHLQCPQLLCTSLFDAYSGWRVMDLGFEYFWMIMMRFIMVDPPLRDLTISMPKLYSDNHIIKRIARANVHALLDEHTANYIPLSVIDWNIMIDVLVARNNMELLEFVLSWVIPRRGDTICMDHIYDMAKREHLTIPTLVRSLTWHKEFDKSQFEKIHRLASAIYQI